MQKILTDNPQDGVVDITSIMYFIYDFTEQKYYDVNSLIIDTVQEDRQINIYAGIGRYNYTAIKINKDDAEYIKGPSEDNNLTDEEIDQLLAD